MAQSHGCTVSQAISCRLHSVRADVRRDFRRRRERHQRTEYHTPVSPLDVWAEYHRLWKEEGWTQQRIARAKGHVTKDDEADETTVRLRCKLHTDLCDAARKATVDGMFDEGHGIAIIGLTVDVHDLQPWLTTAQAQAELVADVLSKHRGKTAGDKPTVKVVREHPKRWKELIAAAEATYARLGESGVVAPRGAASPMLPVRWATTANPVPERDSE